MTEDASPDPYVCLSEGSVIYATDADNRVLFLAKIKTKKYRILRRLREVMKNASVKNILRGSSDEQKMRNGFNADNKKWDLLDQSDAYMRLFEACNALRLSGEWPTEAIGWRYIDFLHAAKAYLAKGPSATAIPAPTVGINDGTVEAEETRKKCRSRRRHRRRGVNRSVDGESSVDEDTAFANLEAEVVVGSGN